tara:strand:+ start:300 stop:605 length:306 start_codon:yes stop_codon:yes gene_type:complete
MIRQSLGLWVTVILAIIAAVSGVIASAFAVSRMLAMLPDMKLVPHCHLGMRYSPSTCLGLHNRVGYVFGGVLRPEPNSVPWGYFLPLYGYRGSLGSSSLFT